MPREIILLTGDAEKPHLESILHRHNPGLKTAVSYTHLTLPTN